MSDRIDNLERENRRMAKKLATGKATTAQHRLAKIARRGIYSGLFLPLLAPLLYYYLGFQAWIAIVYGAFGIIMSIANLLFYRSIVKNDYMSLPLVKAMESAVKIRENLRNIRILGVSIGLGILFSLIFDTAARYNISILGGLLTGCFFGLLIGLKKWREQSRLSRSIIKELRAAMFENESYDYDLDDLDDFDEL